MKNKKKLSPEELKQQREKRYFKQKTRNIFTNMGFHYIPSEGHEFHVGHRAVEVDSIYIFDNIWLFCEETTTNTRNMKDHIRSKNEAFGEIKNNLQDYIDQLASKLPEKRTVLKTTDVDRIRFYGLYIPKFDPELTDDDYLRFSNIIFVLPTTQNYLQWLSKCLKHTARNELFRFIGIEDHEMGYASSSGINTVISAPIIYPRGFVGRHDKVRVVSFMMTPANLMDSGYVLRKDSWDRTSYLYQRLINPKKIEKIRNFIATKGEAFYNNIIVALPNGVKIQDNEGNVKNISDFQDLPENCQLIIPKRRNSICIIDGQHRVFAHYESGNDNEKERKIAQLRSQLHLLVTGLIFENDTPNAERVKIQSEIFLDINDNASPVPANVLLKIKQIQDPIGNESLAQLIIEKLNSQGLFKNMFRLSELENEGIKTASIIRFALKYLITTNPSEGKDGLVNYWNGDKSLLLRGEDGAIDSYTSFCANTMKIYFSGLKQGFEDEWNDTESRILSVVSINAFIIAFTRQLRINGIKDAGYYKKIFEKWEYDFSKQNFIYTSSQYRKFSTDILKGAFGFTDDILQNI